MRAMLQATQLTFSKLKPSGHEYTVTTQLPLRDLNLRYKEASCLFASQRKISLPILSDRRKMTELPIHYRILFYRKAGDAKEWQG